MLRWEPLGENWVKINTDGESKKNHATSYDGTIRDMYGNGKGGFSKDIDICSAFRAKL